ncbi:tyrosine-type recombinase/integrase [Devosia rhizoryzae]|uniref:Tyrosine-type recombinase/integrase n=1 Tax=Devosia rhizoryzae TaxID=2774137 RepID=A0ABX7C6Z8_9HYPH|nr:tyrosine-type recombinase/integrase [Devosia rhizoryzae]QQR38410.1 tyrosine-type recombinase/integrase [Devosia rhizoryzae]
MTAHWFKHIDRLDGAYSDHTLRSYKSDFAMFAAWCRSHRVPFLPASSDTVAAHIEAERTRLKPGTLKRRLAAIRKLHFLANEADPTSDAEVDLAMRRACRSKPSRPQQALGITAEKRDRLLAQCSDDLIGLRDMVLVAVGFDTLCRRGEIVALAVTDFTKRDDGRYSVLIRRAKNDPEGAGRTAQLSTRSSELVDQWLAATGAASGPLLRPVYGSRALALYLEPVTVGRVLKKLSKQAYIQTEGQCRVSGHSLRVGAAQELVMNGRGILQVMRAGGWRSMSVVARYVEHVDLDVWS